MRLFPTLRRLLLAGVILTVMLLRMMAQQSQVPGDAGDKAQGGRDESLSMDGIEAPPGGEGDQRPGESAESATAQLPVPEAEPRDRSEAAQLPEAGEGGEAGGHSIPQLPVEDDEGIVAGAELLPPAGEREQGRVEATVFDVRSGKELPGAIVSIEDVNHSARSDEAGRVNFEQVPVGNLALVVLKSGYEKKVVPIVVTAGGAVEMEIGLTLLPIDSADAEYVMEDFEVVEEYVEEENAIAIPPYEGEIRSMVSGIGRAEFSEAAVSDAAGAVSRVSGASIVDGQFAVVRGLGDRYSNTTVNGALIPSADPARKAVQLDLFPADLLQSVRIYKTLRPDLPGEFTGGLVEIETLRFPAEQVLDFSAGIKYNPEYENAPEYRGLRTGRLNFLGDNAVNPLRHFYRQTAFPASLNETFFKGGGAVSSKEADSHPWGSSFSLLYGDKVAVGSDGELGVILSLTQDSNDSYRNRSRARAAGGNVLLTPEEFARALPGRFEPLAVRPNGQIEGVGTELVATDDVWGQSVDWGALGTIGWKINDSHSLNFTYFRNHSAESVVARSTDLERVDVNASQIEDVISGEYQIGGYDFNFFSEVLDQRIRDLEITQFSGEHGFPVINDRVATLDWIVSRTVASEERPGTLDLQTGYYAELEGSEHGPVSTAQGGGNAQSPTINSTLSDEDATYLSGDVTIPLLGREDDGHFLEFKLGASSFSKTREASGFRAFVRFPIDQGEIENNPPAGSEIGEIVIGDDPTQPRPTGLGLRPGPTVGLSPATSSGSLTFNADGETLLTSYYLMLAGGLDEWEFYAGGRLESESRSYSVDIDGNNPAIRRRDDAVGSQENSAILPSLSLARAFGNDEAHRIELAWSRSIARPIFYEFAPIENFDPVSGETRQGNPELTDALAVNFDLAWTWSPNEQLRFSAAAFHKDIQDPIVQITRNDRLTWENFPSAAVTGIELEFYKEWSNGLSLAANGSHIKAELDPYTETVGNIDRVFEIGALPGQSDFLANVILAYGNDDWGIKTSLVYNFTDSYTLYALDKYSADPAAPPRRGNVVSVPRHTFDLVIAKEFPLLDDHDAKVSFKIRNIFNAPIEFAYEGSSILPYERYEPGTEFDIAFGMTF